MKTATLLFGTVLSMAIAAPALALNPQPLPPKEGPLTKANPAAKRSIIVVGGRTIRVIKPRPSHGTMKFAKIKRVLLNPQPLPPRVAKLTHYR